MVQLRLFTWNLPPCVRDGVTLTRGKAGCTHTSRHSAVGRSGYSWLVVLQHVAGHVSAPPPKKAVAIHPQLPSTAGHPDDWRTAFSAQTYRDRDTVRWSKWSVGKVRRACQEHGTILAAQRAQCAQSVHKVCTKYAQRSSVYTLSQECTIKMIQQQMCTKCIKC
jgi:hypothetical protein